MKSKNGKKKKTGFAGKKAERSFNPKHLTECVRELLGLFKDAWENIDPAELSKNEEEKRTLTQEVDAGMKKIVSRESLSTHSIIMAGLS